MPLHFFHFGRKRSNRRSEEPSPSATQRTEVVRSRKLTLRVGCWHRSDVGQSLDHQTRLLEVYRRYLDLLRKESPYEYQWTVEPVPLQQVVGIGQHTNIICLRVCLVVKSTNNFVISVREFLIYHIGGL